MCGRFVRKGEAGKIARDLGVATGERHWSESHNVAPGSPMPIVVPDFAARSMITATWGFSSAGCAPLFNARAETVGRLPSFRDAFLTSRCLIPASGFFEWRPCDRQPFYFCRTDGLPLLFAGIRRRIGDHVQTAILTVPANADVEGIHHRMPVILGPEAWDPWLQKGLQERSLGGLLSPLREGLLEKWPVSRDVGNVRNDHPGLLRRIDPPPVMQELF